MKFFYPVWVVADLLWALTCRAFTAIDDALDVWSEGE